jgi:uncharacterized Zn-binding protein involved in type VI secretion
MARRLAARVVIDKGAHQGPIKTSCKNVLIGGFLAACKGDALTCSAHGEASIIEGSATVYINGRPAARKDDKTSCGTPPQLTPPIGPQAAKDEYNFISIIPKDKSREDGTAKASVDYVDIKVLNAYANFKDKDKDGRHDFMNSGAVFTETTFKGDGYVGPNNDMNLKGNVGFSVAKGEFNAGSYDGSNGMYGSEAELKGSVLSGKAEGTVASSLGSAGANVSADVLYAEAKVENTIYTGGSEHRYGAQMEASADASAIRAETGGDINFLGIVKAKSKFGLMGGTAAIGGKGGFYLDTDDYEVGLNAGGKIAALVGLHIDLEASVSLKPIVNFFTGEDYVSVVAIPGVILTGCKNVLIG